MNYFDNLQFHEIINRVNNSFVDNNGRDIKLGILRNITVDNYIPLIKYLLKKENYKVELHQGDFDMIFQEILVSNSSMIKFAPEILLVFFYIESISPSICNRFIELSEQELNSEKDQLLSHIERLFEEVNRNFSAKLIFHLFELPSNPDYGISETQNIFGQRQIIDQINESIIALSKKYKDIYFVDLNIIKERLGIENYYDKRYWYIGKAPYSLFALKEIAKEHFKIIKSLDGKIKKCLVLDCDNTLWGGIIGEDGFENIKIGKTYPGNMFLDFQRQILNLYNKGIILAINSKNNESDILEVLEKHPDMLLRRKHFACIYSNWDNKVNNIKKIALDLNLGLDSIVFVDDSEFECNLVKENLKEITVINLPKESFRYAEIISNCGLFDKLQYTNEDKKRGELYRVQVERKKHQDSFTDLNSYYKSLEMELKIELVNEFSISRVSQLTQRTNQFNLTTKRYSVDNIKYFMKSIRHDVLVLSMNDKFGDLGIVGVQILEYEDSDEAYIDSFMMSCRVIGRGVENAFLRAGIEKCFKKNYKVVLASYIETKKNNLVTEFYSSNGFTLISEEGNVKTYKLSSLDKLIPFENNFKEIIKIDGLYE
jgi:FkbH-like protein